MMEQNLLIELTKRLQQGQLTEQEEDEILKTLPEIEKQININKNERRNKKNMEYAEFCDNHENKTKRHELYIKRNQINKILNKASNKWTVFSVLYMFFLVGGGITLGVASVLFNANLVLSILSSGIFVIGGTLLVKPVAKLYSKKYGKYAREEVEITKQIVELNDEMWKEFNAQYESEQKHTKQVDKKPENLKLTNIEDEISL